ncbi:MAG: co-chaperone GroES [Bacillota bacterium]|nr:co-chaperone GroES [Bacillota bacterium]
MKIKPVDDRLLVRPIHEEEKTASGLYLPDTAREKPQEGEILAVGTDEELQKIFKVGDRVLYARYGGNEIKLDGESHLILSRSDILAIVEDA